MSAAQTEFIHPDKLNVKGVRVATIRTLGWPLAGGPLQWLEVMRDSWCHISHSLNYMNRESTLYAFISTFTMGAERETYPRISYPTSSQWRDIFAGSILTSDATKEKASLSPAYNSIFQYSSKNHSFVTTDEGFFGLASSETQASM
jgi:hypothetical protein